MAKRKPDRPRRATEAELARMVAARAEADKRVAAVESAILAGEPLPELAKIPSRRKR